MLQCNHLPVKFLSLLLYLNSCRLRIVKFFLSHLLSTSPRQRLRDSVQHAHSSFSAGQQFFQTWLCAAHSSCCTGPLLAFFKPWLTDFAQPPLSADKSKLTDCPRWTFFSLRPICFQDLSFSTMVLFATHAAEGSCLHVSKCALRSLCCCRQPIRHRRICFAQAVETAWYSSPPSLNLHRFARNAGMLERRRRATIVTVIHSREENQLSPQ